MRQEQPVVGRLEIVDDLQLLRDRLFCRLEYNLDALLSKALRSRHKELMCRGIALSTRRETVSGTSEAVKEVLTVLSDRTTSVHQSGGERDDDEPFALELDRPLGRRHDCCALRGAVDGQARLPLLVDRLHVRAARTDDDDLLRRAGAEERKESGDAVDHSERVDLDLCDKRRCELRSKREEEERVHVLK